MKKFTCFLTLISSLFLVSNAFAQKVAIVGMNHDTPDGFSFVVTEAIVNTDVIYFTENEYSNAGGDFNDQAESVVVFTGATLSIGAVVFVKETGATTNAFFVTCSSGTCGTATISGTGAFAFGSSGESLYAYTDTDANPTNGIDVVLALMYSFNAALPADENPATTHPDAIVISGFTNANPDQTQYKFASGERALTVSKVALENPTNYVYNAANSDLSLVEFADLNLAGANPVLTLTSAAASMAENSGGSFTYTFMLDANATSEITVNFAVSGGATFSTDYSESGAASFNASSGTVTIANGTDSAVITITPSGDSDLEPDEDVILTLSAGTGYDAGSPSSATSTILNDDSTTVTPLVAVTGTNHSGTEGFSFVALVDIAPGTTIYFTENEFNNSTLAFNSGESVVSWTSPGTTIPRGDVIVASETTSNNFDLFCNGASGTDCGTTSVSGNFDLASTGESFSAYSDSDADPTNGITDFYATLYTGPSNGNIPAAEDPTGVYLGSVLVDGFLTDPIRTEYDPALRGVTVDQANFQNTSNWLNGATAGLLSTVPFANIIITTGSTNPTVTVSLSPSSVLEDSGTGMVYTFSMSAAAPVGGTTVNFTIGGSATFTTDYTESGANSFDGANGSVTIAEGNTTVAVTLTPVADSDVEPQETVEIMIASGTGYDGGSPNAATGSITNDDTSDSNPLVALTGVSNNTDEAFSFVAAQDITAGTVVYFTENEFDNTTLLFNTGEADIIWTAPAGGVPAGDVIVATETTTPNSLALTCSAGSGAICGTISVVRNSFALATNGETFYAYADGDNDPTNGVTDIYSVIYTGTSATSGGPIPPTEDPSGIYTQALVIDGFPNADPNRTEYDPTKRGIPVYAADFEDLSNWLHAEPNAPGLSTVPFAFIQIVNVECQFADAFNAGGTGFDDLAGDGFGPFFRFTNGGTGNGGDFVATSTANGDGDTNTDGDIDSAGVAWGLFANTGETSNIVRDFDSPMSNGDIFCIDMDNGWIDTGGTVGFALRNASDENLIEFFFIGGDASYSLNDNGGVFATGIGFSDEGFTLKFTQTAAGIVDVEIIDLGTGASTEFPGRALFNPGGGQVISKIRMFNANAGNGTTNNLYFNNIQHCIDTSDDVPPEIICPVAFDIEQSADCLAELPDLTGDATVSDNISDPADIIVTQSPVAGTLLNLGTTTVTLTAEDEAGNTATCTVDVTVIDVTPPEMFCPADIEVNTDPGLCTAVVEFAVASSDCDGDTLTLSHVSGSAFPVGTTVVTATATDGSGNSSQCSFNIIVNDIEPPMAICQDVTVILDAAGNGSITTSDVDNGSFDNCGAVSLSLSKTNFNCNDVTVPPPTFANKMLISGVIDGPLSGGLPKGIEVFVLEDIPDLSLYGLGSANNGGGSDGEEFTFPAVNATKGQFIYVASEATGFSLFFGFAPDYTDSAANINGDDAIELFFNGSVIDVFGDINTDGTGQPWEHLDGWTYRVDETGPDGSAFVLANWSFSGPNALDGETTNGTAATPYPIGTYTAASGNSNEVVLTVTDLFGNTSQCSATVTVVDDTAPNAVCKVGPIVLQLDESGTASITTADVDDGSNDACGIESLSLDKTDFNCSDVGGPQVGTMTVTDNNGNTSQCTINVIVEDNIPPDVDCKNLTVFLDGAGNASITIGDVLASSSDNCQIAGYSLSQNTFDCNDITGPPPTFANKMLISGAIDGPLTGGVPKAVEFFVLENIADLSLYGFGVANNGGGTDGEEFSFPAVSATAGQYIYVASNTSSFNDFFGFNPDYTSGFASLNGDDAIELFFNGSVIDVFGDINTDGTGEPWEYMDGWAYRNDSTGPDGSTFVLGNWSFSGKNALDGETSNGTAATPFPIGSFTVPSSGVPVTLTVVDASGNSSQCIAMVTVLDETPPEITCPPDVTIECGASIDPANTGSATAEDSCGLVTISYQDATVVTGCGLTKIIQRRWTATDEYQNTVECDQFITIEDNTAPVPPAAPADVTVQCADDIPLPVDLTATDNCDGDITVSPTAQLTPGSCPNDFVMVRTWTFTDVCGNTSSVSQTIVVEDNTAPTPPAAPADLTLQCADDVPVPVALTATDNCDGAITVNPTSQFTPGACLNDFVLVRTWTFTDVCGNTSAVSQTITVEDNTAPVAPAAPADLTLQCADDVPTPVALTATDNCDGAITVNPTSQFTPGACLNDFVLVRTWTFTDVCGNTSAVSQTITVEDNTAPVAPAAPADLTLQCAEDVPAPVDLTAIDNCDGSITASPTTQLTPGSCLNDFVLVRTWTFTDVCGNTSSVSQTITVEDTTPPVIFCPPDITVESEPGECVNLTVDIGQATATDNCIGAITIENDAPTEFGFGDTVVTWTATDQCGNSTTCTQIVTVDKINTITTVTVDPVSQQYSDLVEFEATIDPGDCPGAGGPAAVKVEFFVGTESMGTTNLNLVGGNLVGTLVAPLLETPSDPFDASDEVGPGLKTVTAVFQNVNPNYNVANATTDLTITQEDALVDYTGQTLQATMSSNSSEATVSLCVNIQDIDDGNRGDIRNATITFMNRDNNTVIAGPFQVADLVFAGDTTLGTVCYDWEVDIGNQDAIPYTVGFVVDNYYTRNHTEDNTVITVYKPKGDFITGGGFIIPDSSEGVYASTDGLKTNFGFNVKYNKKGTKVQGRVNIIFRIEQPDGSIRTYQIKSNAKPAFGVDISDPDALFAEFTSKANLKDVTDPLNPISLGGNLTLKVEMTDRGEPGDEDSIGINLTNNSGTLLYSSNWTGTSTDEMVLTGGNIVIHSGFSTSTTAAPPQDEVDPPVFMFELLANENPFDVKASLTLNTTDESTLVSYSVYDSNNKFLYAKTLKPDEKFVFGQGIKSGMYLVIVQQGDNVDQIRLIKK